MSTKTTWEDLAWLGFTVPDVYRLANKFRNGTMSSQKDMYLNTGLSAQYRWVRSRRLFFSFSITLCNRELTTLCLNASWYSYNTIIGSPTVVGRAPTDLVKEQTVWSYDNSDNSEPFEDSWSESWSETFSADLVISKTCTFYTCHVPGVSRLLLWCGSHCLLCMLYWESLATINLNASITIFDVASSGFDITISTDETKTVSKQRTHDISHSWALS